MEIVFSVTKIVLCLEVQQRMQNAIQIVACDLDVKYSNSIKQPKNDFG